jgi:hypothetical protein
VPLLLRWSQCILNACVYCCLTGLNFVRFVSRNCIIAFGLVSQHGDAGGGGGVD